MVRFAQPESVCQAGLEMWAEHPLPAPDQAVSDQPRGAEALRFKVVPPTAVTYFEAAGNSAP